MAQWQNLDEPIETFKTSLGIYGQMVAAAMEQGYTKAQALELVKVWALMTVADSIDDIG